ncbi:uncharacterized oxidoreductase YtbE [Coturnix japonica]|uniref:uncharacterized oxidoreductase YtbE n=1 Tax=Coturnix japonica TaxID=93934 RepID=UPI0013A5EEBF|nr:uncharacterized oxidoreductase YtbE [Coturnix japonica]
MMSTGQRPAEPPSASTPWHGREKAPHRRYKPCPSVCGGRWELQCRHGLCLPCGAASPGAISVFDDAVLSRVASENLWNIGPGTKTYGTPCSGTSHRGGYSHDAVVYAFRQCSIRHIDTAKRYGCESLHQKAIKEGGVKREDLWITTKLWHSDYGYENTKKACLESCERLGVEYLDLYLIHWPDTHVPGKSNQEVRAETWRAMEELYEKGVCRSIGVSNFLISHLEQLQEDCVVTPHVKQVEYHPFQRPRELVDYCRSRGIVFEGYCPLAKGEALTHPSVVQLVKKYGRTPAQICIRWSIQNGIVTIPKSTRPERIQENCKVFDFTIAEDDVEILNGMHDGRHVSWDPSLIV